MFIPNPAPAAERPIIDFTGFDRDIRPQDDFFGHVNGTWLENTPIPADKTRWGSFVILAEESRDAVQAIIEELGRSDQVELGSVEQKIRDLYRSYLDEERIDRLGAAPLAEDLAAIDRLRENHFGTEWAQAVRQGIGRPFSFGVNQDSKESTRYVVYFSQSGLGLPDRDYYFQSGERFDRIRRLYREMLAKLFALAELPDGERRARSVYDLERSIAEGHWTRVQNRDRLKTYNRHSPEELRALLPAFDWDGYLAGSGIAEETRFIVRQPSFWNEMKGVLERTSLEVWKDYYRARLLVDAAPYLSHEFFQAYFAFYFGVLGGQQEPEPRAARGVHLVNQVLGEMVGREYVKRHFSPAAKTRMLELCENLRRAMAQSIDALEWMDEETKREARRKLAKFRVKIGYPDRWRDYSALAIRPGDLLGNLRRASEFVHARQVGKLGKPIDREEWFMNPQTVNAYYNPSMNEIVFPAAILQPPFFHPAADDAVNYGAICMVIGHEIGHGFDDQGRKSDGDGNLRDWWTEKDAEAYEARTGKLVEQYGNYEPLEGQFVNGLLTLGENIGDLGGLTLAWRAWQLSLQGQEPPKVDGHTGAERFFYAYAQIWRLKTRPEMIVQRLKTDPHAPPRFRVIGPLSNFPQFHEVFGVKAGDGMWRAPEERASIW